MKHIYETAKENYDKFILGFKKNNKDNFVRRDFKLMLLHLRKWLFPAMILTDDYSDINDGMFIEINEDSLRV